MPCWVRGRPTRRSGRRSSEAGACAVSQIAVACMPVWCKAVQDVGRAEKPGGESGADRSALLIAALRTTASILGVPASMRARPAATTTSTRPRWPPEPASPPRAKIDRFFAPRRRAVRRARHRIRPDHCGLALADVGEPGDRATVPDRRSGIGAGAETASLACSTRESSMSMPGNFTVGASVMWKLAATLPETGGALAVTSIR